MTGGTGFFTEEAPLTGRERAVLVALVILAVAARLGMCFGATVILHGDTGTYFRMANAIAAGAPMSYFPNGYPLMVVASDAVFGVARRVPALLLLNVVLSTATMLGAFALARRFVSAPLALGVAALMAVWPNQLNHVRQMTSDTPGAFFVLFGILAAVRGQALGAGLLLGGATLLRSSFLPMVPLAALVLALDGRGRAALHLLAGFVLVAGAEQGLILAGIVRASSNFGMNVLIAIGNMSTGKIAYNTRAFSDAERAQPVLTYLDFARDHPGRFLLQRLSALWELWGPWPVPREAGETRSLLISAAMGLRFPILIAALAGLWRFRALATVRLLAVPLLVITVIHTVFFATPRFTLPVEPMLFTLALLFLASVRPRAFFRPLPPAA